MGKMGQRSEKRQKSVSPRLPGSGEANWCLSAVAIGARLPEPTLEKRRLAESSFVIGSRRISA